MQIAGGNLVACTCRHGTLSLSRSPRQRLHPRTQKRPTGEITLMRPTLPTDAPLCNHCVAALIEPDSRAHIDLAAC